MLETRNLHRRALVAKTLIDPNQVNNCRFVPSDFNLRVVNVDKYALRWHYLLCMVADELEILWVLEFP